VFCKLCAIDANLPLLPPKLEIKSEVEKLYDFYFGLDFSKCLCQGAQVGGLLCANNNKLPVITKETVTTCLVCFPTVHSDRSQPLKSLSVLV
jgi:hypothetical protein